jgi:hypothetical protein
MKRESNEAKFSNRQPSDTEKRNLTGDTSTPSPVEGRAYALARMAARIAAIGIPSFAS